MAFHLSDRADFAQFLRGELPAAKNREVVRQMLKAFRSSPEQADSSLRMSWLPSRRGSQSSGEVAFGYSRAFHGSGDRIGGSLEELSRERDQVPDLVSRLKPLPYRDQRRLLVTDRSFQSWSLCEWLIEESHQITYADMGEAEKLADLAVTLAGALEARYYGQELVNDINARAWSCVGNVLRILSDLRSAEDAFAMAESFAERGTGDALEEANVLELKAALRRDQQRPGEAHQLLEEVITVYRRYRDFHLVGRSFVQKGRIYGSTHDLDSAIRWLRKGLGLIDPTRERRLELAARHSLMLYLSESGRHQEAWFLLKASRPEFLEYGGDLLTLRLRWLEGKIQQSLGFEAEAEGALLEARQGFLRQGIGFNAASVSLDLASLYASQGRSAEMRRLAEEMLPIFRSRDVHREAIAALIVFQQAVRMERLSSDLLREIQLYLRRARKDHKLRFEYPL
jgi:tetratricopeptide (TPR) repeat protein